MRFFIGTAHFFAPDYRDAGMHRFAKLLASRGHSVDFVTFGQSKLKQLVKSRERRFARSVRRSDRAGLNPSNISSHVHNELAHPLTGLRLLEIMTTPIERLYGRKLDPKAREAALSADVVILEFGCALYYFDTIKKLNPRAKFIGFYNDRVSVVGFRPELIPLIEAKAPLFDFVRTNAEALLGDLPDDTNGKYVPQGIDKEQLGQNLPSPYPENSRNIVSVGNMLFDANAIDLIAEAVPDTTIHVIGADTQAARDNVIVYGEMPFNKTLRYIANADVGLAPYLPIKGADYLLQSSLKIKQYNFAGLPILLNKDIGLEADNFVPYDLSTPESVRAAVDAAFALGKSPQYGQDLLDWDEVIDYFLELIEEVA